MTDLSRTRPLGALAVPQALASLFSETNRIELWRYVRRRFRQFHSNLQLTPDQIEDGRTKYRGVVAALNRHYWAHRVRPTILSSLARGLRGHKFGLLATLTSSFSCRLTSIIASNSAAATSSLSCCRR